ncbi:MAG: D-glucuronyl C5-epimerase family protein [Solirubrobacteraceae bacterium]
MRATRLAALVLSSVAVGGPTAQPALAGGTTSATALAPVRAHAAAKHGPSVTAALQSLLHSGAIPQATYSKDYAAYVAAKHSLGNLSGTRRVELGAVLANVQAIAAAGQFTPTRLPALFLTLERNRQWWTTEPLISSGERVTFPGSKLIWEYYAGQGIEIQWLATFGEGNGYYLSGHENANLRQLVGEVIPLATARAGGIAWEYLFRFDGGSPPWTSGLSQGTGLEVLARAWSRFKEPADLTAAQQAVGIFETAPPQGVMVKASAGNWYAEYTYAPSDRILNGFIQALVGLYEYTAITKDPLGLQLFEAGDAEARAEVPHFDTGGWSLYDQYGESNLNYHELLTEFLQHLCERTRKGLPYTPAAATPPSTGTTTTPAPSPTTGGTTSTTGGTTATAAAKSAQSTTTPIAADQIYCTVAQRFSADLKTPPAISLLTSTLRGGTRAGVQISLSKISSVQLKVKQGSRLVWSNSATVEHGKPKLLWVTPAKGGTFSVTLTATDLAGNFSTATGTIVVSRH